MNQFSEQPTEHFIYFPKQRNGLFSIIITHDVTGENFKKASQETTCENAQRKKIFIRDFENRFNEKIKNKSGIHKHEYTIYHYISEEELEHLINEKLH